MVNLKKTQNNDQKGDEESTIVAVVVNTGPDFDNTRMINRTKSELIATTPTRILTHFQQIYYFINAPFVKFLYHQVKKLCLFLYRHNYRYSKVILMC